MCYTAPGPRCSGHARTDLDKAQDTFAAAEERFREAEDVLIAGLGPDPAWDAEAKARQTDPQYRAVMKAKWAANDAVIAAQDVYDTTPKGIQALKDEIASLEAGAGRPLIPGVTLHDSPEIEALYGRLDHAQAKRAAQMAAYKEVHGTAPAPTEQVGDSAEDEAAAAAARPLCQCIDYRFKQTCPHVAAVTDQVTAAATLTGYDASLALHAAASKLRTLKTERDRLAALLKQPDAPAGTEAEYAKVNRDVFNQEYDVQDAEEAFYATPTGAAYLRRKIAREQARTGYRNSISAQWEEQATEGEQTRAAAVKAFEQVTGQPAPTDPTTTPPDLPYGNGCTDKCDDFAWTGNCGHVDTQIATQEALSEAVSQVFAGSGYGKALRKEFGVGPAPKGLLGRLRARFTR